MVKVIGKDENLKKRVTCPNCASILEYWPDEVTPRKHTDYGSNIEFYSTIDCPVCPPEYGHPKRIEIQT